MAFSMRFQAGGLTAALVAHFRRIIRGYYRRCARSFPWRNTRDPYAILVSEVMLQQTQTSRVLQKYGAFLEAFPDFASLAAAPLRDILRAWQGLGYNRRAVALHETARVVIRDFEGRLPRSPEALRALPGIGPYTASAVAALAFDEPAVFIETNIRTVFLHFFFAGRDKVRDSEVLPLVQATLDRKRPREWYYALFDYGAMLKQTLHLNSKSAHHRPQGAFEGSHRQLRGRVVRYLVARGHASEQEVSRDTGRRTGEVRQVLAELEREGFVVRDGEGARLR